MVQRWFLRVAMWLFVGCIRSGRFDGWRKFLVVLLSTLAVMSRWEWLWILGFAALQVGTLTAFFLLPLWFTQAFLSLWIGYRAHRGLRSRWWSYPVALALGSLYAVLAYHERHERLAVLLVAWLVGNDDFRRWLRKKLEAARASMTDVQAAMFRRQVEATR